ncbi:MAG: DNA gyrase inhibitor YacG [Acinetobacter sp.]|nr:DNA gyrase inhibitor YacG [Acinetobacter sp.]
MPRTFPCPRCGEASLWENNEFRPFCSERCKMIDLGAWASDEYSIATQDTPQADVKRGEDDYED